MNPKIWGSGGWYLIFVIIYYYNNILNNCDILAYTNIFEELKSLIYDIISNLPCKMCSAHCISNMATNNIMSTTDPNIFLHFFIELYNGFHINSKINRHTISIIRTL